MTAPLDSASFPDVRRGHHRADVVGSVARAAPLTQGAAGARDPFPAETPKRM